MNKPNKHAESKPSALPVLEKMQRITNDRMMRREDCTNRGGYTERLREAAKREGSPKDGHHHD